jgi:hypothetical protein
MVNGVLWRFMLRIYMQEDLIDRVQLPCSWGNKYRSLVLQVVGISKIERVKYGHESRGTRTRDTLRWRGPAATLNYRPTLSLEREPHIKKYKSLKMTSSGEKENLVANPR